jgi:hypothetical protein
MRVRTVLVPWHQFRTDSRRLLEAVALVREHLGDVQWFVGGQEAVDLYMEEEPWLLLEHPPDDVGLGVVVTVPDPPLLARHRSLEDHDVRIPWTGPPHEEADAARMIVRACATLRQQPPPDVVALLAAWDAANRAWNDARRAREDERPVVAEDVADHVRERVEEVTRPLRRRLRDLLEAPDLEAHLVDHTPARGATRTLRELGWMPDPPEGARDPFKVDLDAAVRDHADHLGVPVSEVDDLTRGTIACALLSHAGPDQVADYIAPPVPGSTPKKQDPSTRGPIAKRRSRS